jgi:hypothetical protein
MDRRLLVLIVAAVALIGVVNATVFAYRWMTGTVQIAPAGEAGGAACTGFYSSTAQPGISPTYLPEVGTNYNAPTYDDLQISVSTGRAVCTFDGYNLYESINVFIPITVGYWYIRDFYGFGYYNGTDSVYIWFRLEDPANDGGSLTGASLVVFKVSNSTTEYIGSFDLLSNEGTQWYITSLNSGEALRLDLILNAASDGSVTFRVGVYVSQEYEAP